MRHVEKQTALTFHEVCQTCRHMIELLAQLGQFVLTTPHRRRKPGRQLASARRAQRVFQTPNRTGDIAGQKRREHQADDRAGQEMFDRESRWPRNEAGRWRSLGPPRRPPLGFRAVKADVGGRWRRMIETVNRLGRPDRQANPDHGKQLRQKKETEELPVQTTGPETGHVRPPLNRSTADNPCAARPGCAGGRRSAAAASAGCCSNAHRCCDHSADAGDQALVPRGCPC